MKKILITGGAGFIGIHTAKYFYKKNFKIYIVDNLSRKGTAQNLKSLNKQIKLSFFKIDIRNKKKIENLIKKYKFDIIIHLAAQVAVTTSVLNPIEDFEINVKGTLNILESIRKFSKNSYFINASTNKVYGKINEENLVLLNKEYKLPKYSKGISELQKLDFQSPYGCSKGSADQYTNDYKNIYGLKTINFRQSCIYGPNQFGIEDQGWVSWFTIAILLNKKITVYGNGYQVRDLLYVDDLCNAYYLAYKKKLLGSFNIGGGKENTISVINLIYKLLRITNKKKKFVKKNWRPGDQKLFVSDNSFFKAKTNWRINTNLNKGLKTLVDWTSNNINEIEKILKKN